MPRIVVLAVFLFCAQASAVEKVVVLAPDLAKQRLKHVVTVSAQGGDFTDPVAAVNSIQDATAARPYLVQIEPGVYTLTRTLVMKPFVTVAGSGRDTTTLTGAISTNSYDAASALVSGADNAALLDLTVENTGGGGVSIGLYNNRTSPAIQNVAVTASGGRFSYGVYNEYPSSPVMTDVTAKASGGNYNYGVFTASPP
jgi:pectin methylesterase-like acyl-CoA thioesterase